MSFSPSETAAILPLAIPAAAACLLPIASLDRDQETVKWVRGAVLGVIAQGMIQPHAVTHMQFGVAHQRLIQVAQQQVLKIGVKEIERQSVPRRQWAGHQPGLLCHIGAGMLALGRAGNALQGFGLLLQELRERLLCCIH